VATLLGLARPLAELQNTEWSSSGTGGPIFVICVAVGDNYEGVAIGLVS